MASLDLTLEDARRRWLRGLLALALRGGLGKLVSLASLVILSRLLAPADFGAFAIVLLPVGLALLLGDAGISAALIRRPGHLTAEDERAGFTLRLVLGLALAAMLATLAGPVGRLYRLEAGAVWALRALALSLCCDPLGLIPSVRLNRALRFDRLAWAEAGSLLVGQAAAIAAAFAGWGLASLVAGAVATSLAGMLLVNALAGWRPSFGVSRVAARSLLGFGLPYQAQGLLHLLMGRIVPALGGLVLSGGQVGYLVWAQDLARWPRIPADYTARVSFPAYARFQTDPAALNAMIAEALRLVSLTTFPAAALGIALAPALVPLVFGPEWQPASAPLAIFLAQAPFDALATVLLPVIYASGDARRGLRLSLVWALLAWSASGLALLLAGGVPALAAALAATTAVMSVLILRSLPPGVRLPDWRVIGGPLALAALLGLAVRLGWEALAR
jgi:O-antigen/teichoic acid export membrane protein